MNGVRDAIFKFMTSRQQCGSRWGTSGADMEVAE